MNLVDMFLAGWAISAFLMLILWEVQRRRGSAAIVDIAWAILTGLLGIGFVCMASGNDSRRILVLVMASGWSLRLGVYLFTRLLQEGEDSRYKRVRQQWSQKYFFFFFQAQALWAVMFAAPMLASATNANALGWLDGLGVVLWIVAIGGEFIADRQLASFKADVLNKGHVCQNGLWRYSRHPNYFFEWLHWWTYLCLAFGSPLWWIAATGVVVMLLFLTKITGIPTVETQAVRSRGDAYREYQRTTSRFFPWPPATPR